MVLPFLKKGYTHRRGRRISGLEIKERRRWHDGEKRGHGETEKYRWGDISKFGVRNAPAYAKATEVKRLRRTSLPAPPSVGTGAGRQGMRNADALLF